MELIVRESNPSILLIGANTQDRDFAACLAVRLGTGLTTDCTKLEIDPKSRFLLLNSVYKSYAKMSSQMTMHLT